MGFFRNCCSLKLAFDEKCHDLEMAKMNLQELAIALEEKSANTESEQQHKLQSLAGCLLILTEKYAV
jgi:hypothetical protein